MTFQECFNAADSQVSVDLPLCVDIRFAIDRRLDVAYE
jgi:hypothetical protein